MNATAVVEGTERIEGRGRWRGVWLIFRCNLPVYGLAGVVLVVGIGGILWLAMPAWLMWIVGGGMALGLYWAVASLVVAHLVYDLSPVYRAEWHRRILGSAPGKWVNIHAGLDESTPGLLEAFPGSESEAWDVFDPEETTEASITAARGLGGDRIECSQVDFRNLPAATGELDAVFLIFAAHEIRDAQARREFFAELRRVLKPGGKVVLVEHPRDGWTFAAFGLQCFHFYPWTEWRNVAEATGLELVEEGRVTRFVRVGVFGGQ